MAENLAKDAGVKQSLRQQTSLYRTLDVLDDRFAKESTTAVGRLLQKAQNVLGVPKSEIIEAITLLGGTTLAAGAAPVVVPAIGIYTAGRLGTKAALSPSLRNKIGKILKKAKPRTAEEKSVINQLKKLNNGDISVIKVSE